ncbi:gamma-aminobutyric acid type B receptor subunit 1-like isoform X1 [Penaeus japonicus]|uniref:gamma-aminobutyric acid type B receptor subunit 1-like isoform X1 n=1 Tax=Penaeus japonicus TaxID=27405 RepID=UPI001C70BD2F|nr:gamma-aminobutyric acid type B receptor subunit 1-like isoform X1 [Penaeus japonicus]XP_042890501.1 gamma-aminobutyric acid type B receptor subunit 1-like isoform X1 [Penaeus japonicus]XP_042890503.1 gamma-aminobutyric acid type B receptor subunit 1-like isoform X1 [Penaeus japonicus]XP_042890504.1 gamma-aminobutyric acid type B receptor subunit 1-like isoform X1 [Penaeus japonicus]XP_042890505.1 gamma-aminobutyric acid type B receptor subunit 1-like isoform X1 [Penaeus japonicus]
MKVSAWAWVAVVAALGAAAIEERLLHIGGIFPIHGSGGWQGGQACQPAAMLALEDVNNRPDLLPGYKLNLAWNDSLCEPGLGAAVMYDLLYNPPTKLMLLGGCSTVSTTIGEAAKMWNLVVLSYGSSSPALADRNRFPTFFRTHPSATVHNPLRIKIMQKYDWSRVAILQQAEEVFISTVEDLEVRCKEAGIEIVTRQSFLSDPTDAVRNLKRQDARIIVGLFYVVAARRVLCEIYKNKLYGKSYVWFFIGWYEDGWYEQHLQEEELNCTRDEMRVAAEGHLTTEALMWNKDNEKTISGMTVGDFRRRLNRALIDNGYRNGSTPVGYQEAPLAYDAVWSVALALNRTMERLTARNTSIEKFTYTNKEIADELYSAMNATQFLGVSGRVAFSTDGDRIAWTQVEQMIDGKYNILGYFDGQTDNLTWFNLESWVDGKAPPDRTIVRRQLRTVSLGLFISMCTISAVGAMWALMLLVFTFVYRHRRLIQMSHPACNNITLVGIILCLGSIFLLGLDGQFVSEQKFPSVCGLRAWCLSLGFTLAYGAMFSKIWRVHRLTTKTKTENKFSKIWRGHRVTRRRHQPVQRVEPWKLYVMVGSFVVVDVIVLGVWQGVDPQQRTLEVFPLEVPRDTVEDIKIKPELEHCESHHNTIWLGLLYSYKGLLLIFGLFLAYETRSVKLKQINDSRLVGMSIYNVVVLCLITAPVTLVISSQQDAAFAFVSLAIIFCCFLSMALVFVPKIVEVMRHVERAESTVDGAPSKEEEERYQKLLRENEDMQRIISEKEEKIRLLKLKLQERAAIRSREQQAAENHVTAVDATQQMRLRQGGRPAVRIVTPEAPGADESMVPRINFDISESYL